LKTFFDAKTLPVFSSEDGLVGGVGGVKTSVSANLYARWTFSRWPKSCRQLARLLLLRVNKTTTNKLPTLLFSGRRG